MKDLLPQRVAFTKLHAGGNDFVCIDNTDGTYNRLLASENLGTVVRHICRRGLGVGADGVIFACERGNGQGVDIVARFLEPDGSEARLCGNGTACFTYWALAKELVPGPDVDILTAAGAAHGCPDENRSRRVRVCVPDPGPPDRDVVLRIDGETVRMDVINTGVPHAVVFVDDLEAVDVAHLGKAIRNHPRFEPGGGVNVNFTRVLDTGRIAVRTFEFGVEAETLACGTGSTAAAIMSAVRFDWPTHFRNGQEPVLVEVRGGETLRIWFTVREDGLICDVCLETGVSPVYEGELRGELLEDVFEKLI